ncbi:Tn3 family transposase [Candidatus Hamiltonella defensa]|nr:Tn3 family transposase [Candidatus Hamiltonella defensa]
MAKSLREIGRIKKRCLCSNDFAIGLRRRVQSALNKAENRNAVARAVFAKADSRKRKRQRHKTWNTCIYESDGDRYRSLSGTEQIGKL